VHAFAQANSSSDLYESTVYSSAPLSDHPGMDQYYTSDMNGHLAASTSIGTLPQFSSSTQLSKTDSHAVLMELFARDQDLVRQATESARLKAESKQQPQLGSTTQHPMRAPSLTGLSAVPTLNSWPHFSSITSLSNLGTLPGVKSIASLSGADLVSKGSLNRMGNLAQVKSMDSMGKNDSYAFLEVFFGDRSSNNLSGMAGGRDLRGLKQSGEEDNEIGLSLEDESPSHGTIKREYSMLGSLSGASQPPPNSDSGMDTGTLKRAYDDALAARGLISVSRSCENLTDLVLPDKIQRTLSQEFISRDKQTQAQGQAPQYIPYASYLPEPQNQSASTQYPGEQPVEPQQNQYLPSEAASKDTPSFDPSESDGHVQVPATTTCALCLQTNVDTQLRPCGHMFHERCLKPSLQKPMGPPKCPVDNIPMQSALLAVPTEEPALPPTVSSSWGFPSSLSLENPEV
jgi:Zinc finger, C3HC4 type (RING finger)